jgi:hypothetical protein
MIQKNKLNMTVMALIATLMCCMQMAAADPIASSGGESFLLSPPEEVRPVVVRASFKFHDINEIKDELETFDFSGVLMLKWHDPRQAFDPVAEGANEKVFQGNYQFNELAAGWYPQVVLINESGMYQKSGVLLRVQPDGTSTLIETLNATAKSEYNMTRYPLDRQRLEVIFEVLGFDRGEVLLQVDSEEASFLASAVRIPQWTVTGARASVRDRNEFYAGQEGVSSAFTVSVNVQRKSYYMIRLVVIPLILIVLLSFSVFWMDKSSIGDRLSVSFIGILTSVAYQSIISAQMPHIAYITLMHGFLTFSFLAMCATVVINLVVNTLDKRGKIELGDRIDLRCRWGFPLGYFGINLVWFGLVMLVL